jgi:electron transfer flavoprotein alpha subunit
VGVKLEASVASNVIALPTLSNGFVVRKGVFTGKGFADVQLPNAVKVLTVKKNAVAATPTNATATVSTLDVTVAASAVTVKETHKQSGDISLPEADVVVSAGRGLKGPEHWGIVEDLAKTLGAATACSKPVSDMDWRPHHEHVGQTGIKVSPNLYIALGISGAIQHLAGVNSSKVIVVVNKDPEAPFFKSADYGIVGDVFEVLPKLHEAFKQIL